MLRSTERAPLPRLAFKIDHRACCALRLTDADRWQLSHCSNPRLQRFRASPMQAKSPVRRRNAVLDHVSDKDFAHLEPLLEHVDLPHRMHLQAANRRIERVYFIESGLASTVAIGGGERKQAEVAIIGHEGFVGIPLVLGDDRSPHEIFMQAEGEGHALPASAFSEIPQVAPAVSGSYRYLRRYSCRHLSLARTTKSAGPSAAHPPRPQQHADQPGRNGSDADYG